MKVARVRYTGNMRHLRTRGPSKEEYYLKNPFGGSPRWVDVEDVEDAEWFDQEGRTEFDVEWTAVGELVRAVDTPNTGVEAMLSNLGYRAKQRLAKRFDIKANKTEDELDEALRPEVESLIDSMEIN